MASSHQAFSKEDIARVAARIPPGTWDTHMHVVDLDRFSIDTSVAVIRPSSHKLAEARQLLSPLGISKMVVIQPSFYGNDNGCTLDGLQQLGPAYGRAVIQFDPNTTSASQLNEWHALGVRGVRLNFKSIGAQVTADALHTKLRQYADAVRPLNWVLQIYVGMEDLPLLEHASAGLDDVKFCIDHYAHPSDAALSTAPSLDVLPGFSSLVNLLTLRQNFWIKCSASYRLSVDPKHPLVSALRRTILRLRPDRCVFATDWPHTRFEDVNLPAHLDAFFDACELEGVPLERICVGNAEELFDVKGES